MKERETKVVRKCAGADSCHESGEAKELMPKRLKSCFEGFKCANICTTGKLAAVADLL